MKIPRPRHWILWGYVGLVAASDVVRWLHPVDGVPRPDERVVTVRAVDGNRELDRPVRIAYREREPAGAGDSTPTIILVHGSPGDNSEVRGMGAILGERYRTIAPDLPGFGGSTWDVPDYSNLAHAHYLLQLMDSLHLARAHLVGFSMGGGVILRMEDLAPDRVQSLVMLSAIGVQEYELLGDYHLNHAIHAIQLAGLWLLREATPHFGWLDDAALNVPYARNFYDTDQRPYRGILEHYPGPMLILQGDRDPLVNPAIAIEHARIVPQAELIMSHGDHFTAFMHPEREARPIAAFVDRVERGDAVTRATADPARLAAAARPFDPRSLPRLSGLSLIVVLLLLAAATLVSEDLTCITAGLMVARGTLGFWPAVTACFVGIFAGDILLFLVGRALGRAVLARAPLRWFVSAEAVALSSQWIDRQGAALVFATRLLPGTRLPTYLAAGMLRTSFVRFTLYFALACLVWTPLLVGASAVFGEAAQATLTVFRHRAALYLVVAGLAMFVLLKLVIPLATHRGRRLLLGRWRRLTRWEFWPRWAFYPPIVVYILWLAIRHRSLTLFTAANPAIPGGGFVGESKAAILRDLGSDRVARFALLEASLAPAARLERLRAFQTELDPAWPVVLKPDIGERGSGVAIVHAEAEARAYLGRARGDVIAQQYIPGPEYGIFYVRHPDEERGRIFSVTEKRLPVLYGDGRRSLEDLILDDDRAVCMAKLHLRRHAARLTWVPPAGELVPLVELGTHCRGATFYDGIGLVTPELGEAIDRLSRGYQGFWFGRYDIRVPRVEDLQAGRNLTVLELNGATAEATSIYDPANRLGSAYRTLRTQWRLLFEIGAANLARGARPATLRELWQLVRAHRRAMRGRE